MCLHTYILCHYAMKHLSKMMTMAAVFSGKHVCLTPSPNTKHPEQPNKKHSMHKRAYVLGLCLLSGVESV